MSVGVWRCAGHSINNDNRFGVAVLLLRWVLSGWRLYKRDLTSLRGSLCAFIWLFIATPLQKAILRSAFCWNLCSAELMDNFHKFDIRSSPRLIPFPAFDGGQVFRYTLGNYIFCALISTAERVTADEIHRRRWYSEKGFAQCSLKIAHSSRARSKRRLPAGGEGKGVQIANNTCPYVCSSRLHNNWIWIKAVDGERTWTRWPASSNGKPRWLPKFGKDSTSPSTFHLELMTLHCVRSVSLLAGDTKRDIFEGINDDMFAFELMCLNTKNILRKSSVHTSHRLVASTRMWSSRVLPAFHLQASFFNLPFSRSDSC